VLVYLFALPSGTLSCSLFNFISVLIAVLCPVSTIPLPFPYTVAAAACLGSSASLIGWPATERNNGKHRTRSYFNGRTVTAAFCSFYGCNGTELSYVIFTEQQNITTAERRNGEGIVGTRHYLFNIVLWAWACVCVCVCVCACLCFYMCACVYGIRCVRSLCVLKVSLLLLLSFCRYSFSLRVDFRSWRIWQWWM